jgi:hypothetical protein
VLSAFEMTDASGVVHKMYLVRNPWGITYYSSDWYYGDSRWTTALINQVPLGVNPTTDQNKGLFVVPHDKIMNEQCISSLQIGHLRDAEGYNKTWFDEE